jgi:hypothetical protein
MFIRLEYITSFVSFLIFTFILYKFINVKNTEKIDNYFNDIFRQNFIEITEEVREKEMYLNIQNNKKAQIQSQIDYFKKLINRNKIIFLEQEKNTILMYDKIIKNKSQNIIKKMLKNHIDEFTENLEILLAKDKNVKNIFTKNIL